MSEFQLVNDKIFSFGKDTYYRSPQSMNIDGKTYLSFTSNRNAIISRIASHVKKSPQAVTEEDIDDFIRGWDQGKKEAEALAQQAKNQVRKNQIDAVSGNQSNLSSDNNSDDNDCDWDLNYWIIREQ